MAELVPVDHDPFAAPSALEGPSPAPTPSWSPTTLSPEDEVKFKRDMAEKPEYKAWADTFQQRFGESPNLDDPKYDYRGAWQGGIVPTPYEPDQNFPHWPSALPSGQMLKAPDHPTAWMEHFMREYKVDPNLAPPEMIDEGRQKGLVPQDWHGPGLGGSDARVPGPQSALEGEARPAGRFAGMAGLGSNPTEKVLFGGQQGAANLGPGPAGPADIAAAQAMEGTKSSADQIFASTGWYRGPDGEWKWVLPDKDISLNRSAFTLSKGGEGEPSFRLNPRSEGEPPLKLPDVINHPDLFKAYPEFVSTAVGALPDNMARQGVVADYNPRTNEIRLGTATQTDVLSSVLHEVQHHIQRAEGFASGGNINMFLPRDFGDRAYKAMLKTKDVRESIDSLKPEVSSGALQNLIERQLSGEGFTPNAKSAFDFYSKRVPKDVLDNFTKLIKDEIMPIRKMESDAFENYRKIAGETESRQVQKQFETQNWDTRPTAMPGFAPATEQHVQRITDPYGKFTPGVSYHQVDYDPFRQSALGQEM